MPRGNLIYATLTISPGDSEADSLEGYIQDVSFKMPKHRFAALGKPPPLGQLMTPPELTTYGTDLGAWLAKPKAFGGVLSILYGAVPQDAVALRLELEPLVGELIRWEVLYEAQNGFLGAQAGRSICRVPADGGNVPARAYEVPVRLWAFLSAAGRSAKDELWGLYDEAMRRKGKLPIALTVFLGEQDLLDQALAKKATGELPDFDPRPMPSTSEGIQDVLRDDRPPHLLHFFCHGIVDPPAGFEFATIADWDNDAESGNSRLSLKRLLATRVLTHVWATIFNCCDGGRPPANGLGSMAYSAVAEGEAPVAVGMTAPVDASEASTFSRAFYRQAFDDLETFIASAGDQLVLGDFDLAHAVTAGRAALFELMAVDPPPDRYSAWSYPVVYRGRTPLQLYRAAAAKPVVERPPEPAPLAGAAPAAAAGPVVIEPVAPEPVVEAAAESPDAALRQRARMIAAFLATLSPDAPEGLRNDVLAMFDSDPVVPAALRCDRQGRFPGAMP